MPGRKNKGGVLPQITIEQIVGILTILAILITGGMWVYNYLGTPHFEPGHAYASAYFQYDDIENYLYIEVIPDGQGKAIKAACDALKEVSSHRWINHDIKDKPIRVILGWRTETVFVPYVFWVEYPADMDRMGEKQCLDNSTKALMHFMKRVSADQNLTIQTMYDRYLISVERGNVSAIPLEEITELKVDGDNPVFTSWHSRLTSEQ